MKVKDEVKIALISVVTIYLVFTVIKFIFFPEQSMLWHAATSLLGLFFLFFFGYIVKVVDVALDKRYPFERNPFKRIILQFAITLGIVLLIRLLSAYFWMEHFPVQLTRELFVAGLAINVFMVLSVILSIFGYHFFKRWKEEKVAALELEREKAVVQYDNLKNQLNPHFLFNSLSSLNSLIFENPALASEFLQQLSKVYRYVLENKEKNLVSVSTEVKFVNHYAQLLKTRFDGALDIQFNLSDNAMAGKVVPVTLQILLENATKHNVTSRNVPLTIQVYDKDGYLIVENNLQKKHIMELSNGQGLENLRNLYKFLSQKPVVVEQTTEVFAVKVPLIE